MYYAITIDADGMITDKHSSMTPITVETFINSSDYSGQEVREVSQESEYYRGFHLAEFDDDGMLRPLIDRVNDGLTPIPEGYELIDGELVAANLPVEETPMTLLNRLEAAEAAARTAYQAEASATRIVFRALAKQEALEVTDILENKSMLDEWRLNRSLKAGDVIRYGDHVYRVLQTHATQADWTPDIDPSLFSRVSLEKEIIAWTQGSYGQGVIVTHNNKTWESMVDNNVWEPGAPGVYENIWREIADG